MPENLSHHPNRCSIHFLPPGSSYQSVIEESREVFRGQRGHLSLKGAIQSRACVIYINWLDFFSWSLGFNNATQQQLMISQGWCIQAQGHQRNACDSSNFHGKKALEWHYATFTNSNESTLYGLIASNIVCPQWMLQQVWTPLALFCNTCAEPQTWCRKSLLVGFDQSCRRDSACYGGGVYRQCSWSQTAWQREEGGRRAAGAHLAHFLCRTYF